MKVKLTDHGLQSIKNKLIVIYFLNVTDIIFTYILLNTGLFLEVNAIMNRVIDNKALSFCIKVILPAVVIYIVLRRMERATNTQLKLANNLVNLCMILYILINISHIVYMVLHFYLHIL